MENNNNFEDRIKAQLKNKAEEVAPSHELYSRIMTDIMKKKRGNFILFRDKISNMSKKSIAAAVLCITLLSAGITYSSSSSVRAFAAETASKIKTIFVVDGSSKEYKVLEEPAQKPILAMSYGETTNLSDAELSKKIGFQVSFPKELPHEFSLKGKSEFVALGKIDYETGQKLENQIKMAINDEVIFNSLSAYRPYRGAYAFYISNKREVSIFVSPIQKEVESQLNSGKYSVLDINGAKGYWVDIPVPNYPIVSKDGTSYTDMTQKPTEINLTHSLIWLSDGTFHQFVFQKDNELSQNEAIELAKTLISSNKKN